MSWEWVDSCNWMNDVMCRNISLCNKGKRGLKEISKMLVLQNES